MWEKFIDDWKSTRKNSDWICESCIYYPPSSCDGKPCCVCDPDEPLMLREEAGIEIQYC